MAKKRAPLFDVAEYLDSPEVVAEYLNEALQSGNVELIYKAIDNIARARGMTWIAREAGLSRENLYKALSGETSPEFATIMKVLGALGMQIVAQPKPEREPAAMNSC
jgi:probable addiction module antidote protein